MKRILKFLARLYPAAWRKRYGAEYEALIEDASPRARDGFDVLWGAMKMRITARSFVRIVLPCALVGAMVAVGISFSRPVVYRSETLIKMESDHQQSIPGVVVGLVQEAWTAPFLTRIIQGENLYPRERMRMPIGDVIDRMRNDIRIQRLQTKDGKTAPAFVVVFDYADPHVAQRMDEELVSQLMATNLRAVTASSTSEFLNEELKGVRDPASKARMESQLRQSENAASQWHGTFTVLDRASLPQKPMGLGRIGLGMVGMLAGLLAGLAAAAITGSRILTNADLKG